MFLSFLNGDHFKIKLLIGIVSLCDFDWQGGSYLLRQPRSQGLSCYRLLGERGERDPPELAPGGGKMRDPGN